MNQGSGNSGWCIRGTRHPDRLQRMIDHNGIEKDKSIEKVLLPGPEKYRQGRSELTWSPGGRYFAYVVAFGRGAPVSEIWILRLADGKAFAITDSTTWDFNPIWSLDESILYFISDRGEGKDLWRQSLPVSSSH